MKEILLLKLGEIVLKGLNRGTFEKRLMKNIAWRIRDLGEFKIYCMQSTIYVEPQGECDMSYVEERISRVFGIVSICRAAECEKNMDAIFLTATEFLKDKLESAKTFKVDAKRADKSFPKKSPEICMEIGGKLHDLYPHLSVDVKNPELLIKVEVRDRAAFVHANPRPGAGGMPVGANGRAALLLSGGIDSPVAGYMIAKRGVSLMGIHFFSYPYTSERAKQKVIELAEKVSAYTGKMYVAMVPFTKIQEEIRDKCDEDLFTLIMRRFMMRIAEKIAIKNDCKALITGESLGQVASQTMEALGVTASMCTLPVLRPVIGMDKEEIVVISRKIDTFETSILPYEDCCTVFTPKHPKTKPRLCDLEAAETALDIDALVEEAIVNTEFVEI
ncbi:MAG: tRNA 4-thiouridine(8) synthase ThiI [Clostridia bacterium]|nr:tRNA 4-thiouridine(8) synthase ThiI [Clostridia bacterium]